jgi:hypothetical protein
MTQFLGFFIGFFEFQHFFEIQRYRSATAVFKVLSANEKR